MLLFFCLLHGEGEAQARACDSASPPCVEEFARALGGARKKERLTPATEIPGVSQSCARPHLLDPCLGVPSRPRPPISGKHHATPCPAFGSHCPQHFFDDVPLLEAQVIVAVVGPMEVSQAGVAGSGAG